MANAPFARFKVVEYSCRHRREFPVKGNIPALGEKVWCPRCTRESSVIKHLEEFRVRCSNCPYSRAFGANRLQAEIAASKHHNKLPWHEVTLWFGSKKDHIWPKNDQHLFAKALPRTPVDTVDLPPF